MSTDQLAELDVWISPMIAADMLLQKRAHMKPKEVYELALLASNDKNIAEREWARQVDFESMQKENFDK